jgi:hypothetical protein
LNPCDSKRKGNKRLAEDGKRLYRLLILISGEDSIVTRRALFIGRAFINQLISKLPINTFL